MAKALGLCFCLVDLGFSALDLTLKFLDFCAVSGLDFRCLFVDFLKTLVHLFNLLRLCVANVLLTSILLEESLHLNVHFLVSLLTLAQILFCAAELHLYVAKGVLQLFNLEVCKTQHLLALVLSTFGLISAQSRPSMGTVRSSSLSLSRCVGGIFLNLRAMCPIRPSV